MGYIRNHPMIIVLLLTINLDQGEQMCAEAGAIVSYSDDSTVKTKASGRLFNSLTRNLEQLTVKFKSNLSNRIPFTGEKSASTLATLD